MALSRAKHGLIIVGHLDTLKKDQQWKMLINWLDTQNVIVNGLEEFKNKILEYEEAELQERMRPLNLEEDFM